MVERVLAGLATRQKGVATRRELLKAGVTPEEIRHRLRVGALHLEFPGVYRVGHRAPHVEARYLAAVRACGERAVLAGRAAAYLYGLIKGHTPRPEVTALTERRIAGIVTHRSRVPLGHDAKTYHGIPITTVARTLVDLAAVLDLDDLARACHEAGVKHGTTPRQVKAVLARRPNAPGAAKLWAVIDGDAKVVLSRLEGGFLKLLTANDLPLPETNRPAGGRRVDCRWPDLRLTVELDSYRFHNSRHAWEQDRQREREARARGDDFRRYTWGDVFETPARTVRELRPLLLATDDPA
jgi:hypothetical protein